MKKSIMLVMLVVSSTLALAYEEKWVTCTNNAVQILDSYYEDGVTFTWEGTTKDGKADGYGTATKYVNGQLHSTYIGDYKEGLREGNGKIIWPDERELTCVFIENQATGEGIWTHPNGTIYKGHFVNYNRHGLGECQYANGDIDKGFFVNGSLYQGQKQTYDGGISYIDHFRIVSSPVVVNQSSYTPTIGKMITEYYDKDWNRCSAQQAMYYRRVNYKAPNIPDGAVRDFYMNGTLQSVAYYAYVDYEDSNKDFHVGHFVNYFSNGNKWKEYDYVDNQMSGRCYEYYENGSPYIISDLLGEKPHGEFYKYYPNGHMHIYAYYQNGQLVDNKYVEFTEDGSAAITYNESFIKHRNNWESKDAISYSKINDRIVILNNTSKEKVAARTIYIPFDQSSDYVLDATISLSNAKNNSVGFLVGWKDWDNYCAIYLSSDQSFFIINKVEGVRKDIRSSTSCSSIKLNTTNRVQLFKVDNKWKFFINGNKVAYSEAYTLRGSNFGIVANSKGIFGLHSLLLLSGKNG